MRDRIICARVRPGHIPPPGTQTRFCTLCDRPVYLSKHMVGRDGVLTCLECAVDKDGIGPQEFRVTPEVLAEVNAYLGESMTTDEALGLAKRGFIMEFIRRRRGR